MDLHKTFSPEEVNRRNKNKKKCCGFHCFSETAGLEPGFVIKHPT